MAFTALNSSVERLEKSAVLRKQYAKNLEKYNNQVKNQANKHLALKEKGENINGSLVQQYYSKEDRIQAGLDYVDRRQGSNLTAIERAKKGEDLTRTELKNMILTGQVISDVKNSKVYTVTKARQAHRQSVDTLEGYGVDVANFNQAELEAFYRYLNEMKELGEEFYKEEMVNIVAAGGVKRSIEFEQDTNNPDRLRVKMVKQISNEGNNEYKQLKADTIKAIELKQAADILGPGAFKG